MRVATFLLAALVVPARLFAATEAPSVERLYSEWRFEEADGALAAQVKAHPGEPGTLVAKAYERFLAGDFRASVAEFQAAAARGAATASFKELTRLAQTSADTVDGYLEQRSAHFVFRFPAEDKVLADYGLQKKTLRAQSPKTAPASAHTARRRHRPRRANRRRRPQTPERGR